MKELMTVAAVAIGLAGPGYAVADTIYDCEATFFTQSEGSIQGRLWLSDNGRADAGQFRREAGRLEFTENVPVSWRGDQVRMTVGDAPAVGHGEASGGFIRFTGVWGAARDGFWWADCLESPSGPAWARDGETVTGAEQELLALQGLDLDTGRIVDARSSEDMDIFVGLFMGRNPIVVAGPEARIMLSEAPAEFTELDPRTAGCSGVRDERVGQGVPFASIERGAIICVLTDERFLGALRVTSADGGDDPHLQFSFERWGALR